ncbi:MAG: hypothetical protein JSW66_11700 [Phycisphaerales bacterium]|nr:MAG: hypothetical protein JSW66_11700 [Phycisphaerales bacterium]
MGFAVLPLEKIYQSDRGGLQGELLRASSADTSSEEIRSERAWLLGKISPVDPPAEISAAVEAARCRQAAACLVIVRRASRWSAMFHVKQFFLKIPYFALAKVQKLQ